MGGDRWGVGGEWVGIGEEWRNDMLCAMNQFGLTIEEVWVVGTLAKVHQNIHEASPGRCLAKHICTGLHVAVAH